MVRHTTACLVEKASVWKVHKSFEIFESFTVKLPEFLESFTRTTFT